MEVGDARAFLNDLDGDDIIEIKALTIQAAFRMAKALKERGYEIDFGDTEEAEGVEEAPKPKGPKATRLTKANKVSIDECYKNTVWEEGDTEDFKRKNVAADLKLNEEQVLRYFAKQAKKEKG